MNIYIEELQNYCFFLNYNDLRNRLMDKCKNSENEDIVEIYTDFISQYNIC